MNINGIIAQPCRSGIVRGGEVRRRIGVMILIFGAITVLPLVW